MIFNNMKTKNMKTTKMTTMMMITAAALIGTISIGAQSAFADTIDFEGTCSVQVTAPITTATNDVTLEVGPGTTPDDDGYSVEVGSPREAFANSDQGDDTPFNNPVGNNCFYSDDNAGFAATDSYFVSFDTPVANLSLDLYDYSDDTGSANVCSGGDACRIGDVATLEVFSDLARTISVGTATYTVTAAYEDGLIANLSVLSPSDPILSASVTFSAPDRGTGIDNITFDTYTIDLGEVCSDGDEICKSAIAADANANGFVEVGELILFHQEITVTNPDDGVDWLDTVVTDNFGAEIQEIDCDAGDITSKNGKSAKKSLGWTIGLLSDDSSVSNSCDSETGLDPDGEQWYTECGVHEYNSGAVVKAGVLKDNGKAKLQQIAYSTDSILVSVYTPDLAGDCDGDGIDDIDEVNAASCLDAFNDDSDYDGLLDGDEVNTYSSDPCIANTILVDSALTASPGGAVDFVHHTSTGLPYGSGVCGPFSGTAFVLDNGYVTVSATGLIRDFLCIVPTPTHDDVDITLHCDEGDVGPTSSVPLSTAGGAATEGDFSLTDSLGAIGTCTSPTLYVDSVVNGKWLAKSP